MYKIPLLSSNVHSFIAYTKQTKNKKKKRKNDADVFLFGPEILNFFDVLFLRFCHTCSIKSYFFRKSFLQQI